VFCHNNDTLIENRITRSNDDQVYRRKIDLEFFKPVNLFLSGIILNAIFLPIAIGIK